MFDGHSVISWPIHDPLSQFSGDENHVKFRVLIDLGRTHKAKKTQLLKRGTKPGMFYL
jgi:hypothetical protein